MKSRTPIILAALIILAAAFLLFDFRLPDNTRFWRQLQNLGHIPLFGLVAIALLIFTEKIIGRFFHSRILLYSVAFVASAFMGAATEAIQYFTPRDADINDWLFDIVGSVVFLGLYFTIDPKNKHIWKRAGGFLKHSTQFILLAVAGIVMLPQILLGTAYLNRDKAFPVIADFESGWEKQFLNLENAQLEIVRAPAGWKDSAEDNVGKVTFEKAQYPGVSIYETAPDWSRYNYLSFEVYSEMPDTVSLSIRIDDIHHNCNFDDRYTGRFRIHPGENTVMISFEALRQTPSGRFMDMEQITHLVIFMVDPPEPRTLYLDQIRLE